MKTSLMEQKEAMIGKHPFGGGTGWSAAALMEEENEIYNQNFMLPAGYIKEYVFCP